MIKISHRRLRIQTVWWLRFACFAMFFASLESSNFAIGDLIYATSVIGVDPGGGSPHPDFDNPNDVLGIPNYSGGPFGTGAFSLGTGGAIIVEMAEFFVGDQSPSMDLVIYEIGPANGAAAEGVSVEVSENGVSWLSAGTSPGGSNGIDLDGFGLGATRFRYIRLVDITGNASQPGGADIDAIQANFTAIPEPSSGLYISFLFGSALLFYRNKRFERDWGSF